MHTLTENLDTKYRIICLDKLPLPSTGGNVLGKLLKKKKLLLLQIKTLHITTKLLNFFSRLIILLK